MKRLVFRILILIFYLAQTAHAQVTPNINSGNPAFPFPQFLDYGPARKTLASVNAPGLTHAEMEQRTIEAWQLVCNNTSKYGNVVVGGVQYLYPTAPNHCTCVEGDGYYLLGAAIMGDKTFFDGYYMWTHDRGFNGVKRFIDGVENRYGNYSRGLSYSGGFGAGTDVYGGGISGNSATDGDVDVALALLIAYKQWGEHSGIFLNHGGWGGKEINYKEEALNYIRAMVDTSIFPPALPERNHVTGVVGLDGYIKRGDSWGELTDWAVNGYLGMKPQTGSSGAHYIDYNAPAWFKQFEKFLAQENERQFLLDQYRRGEASSDWLIGLHYSKDAKNIPYMGKVESLANNDFRFGNYIPDGEDFRGPWRTIMNYVWHGNPDYTWDPVTHQVKPGIPNTFEYDMGLRYAQFLKNNQGSPWNNPCRNIGDLSPHITFKGPYTLLNGYAPDGSINGGSFPLNWIHGTGAASAITAQDFELMGEMFRHCVIAWDAATGQNLDSRPVYFHEWFRLCGLLTLAGNFHAPENMIARPNLKVYHKVDKTFCFTGDEVTYTISYRNYGSVDAAGAVIKFGIPAGFVFVSSTKGSLSGDSVVWNAGTIKGFKTGGLAATIDSMKVTLKVGPTASGRYCTNARIYCSNGLGWTSNEYPNNITAVMERNCVDVVKRALRIEKTAARKEVNPVTNGDVVYKIKFENSSDAGWINGGRPGVRLAFAHEDLASPSSAAANVLKYRLFHDAAEPYIDYGNYRVSYFMNDPNIKSYSTTGGTASWGLQNTIAEGVNKDLVTVTHEQIVPGSDANGSWNQRIVLQFSPQLATITQHLQQYAGSPSMVHEGGTASLRGVWRLYTNNYINVDWTDDWSWDPTFKDGDDGIYFPIGDDYTDPDNLGLPINSWHKSACQTTNQIVKNVLVEEWDGYVWRRVLGNGPLPGRDITNVIVTDTLPQGVSLKNFIRQTALGITATTSPLRDGRTLIKWSIPKMQINQKDSLIFTVTISGSCPGPDSKLINRAWIEGNSESAIFDSDTITVTCNPVTVCPTPTTLIKNSDKLTYTTGETVQYSLKYTQTQGSMANPDLSASGDWTAQSGAKSNASFGNGQVSIGQINNGDLVLTHDYSYGTNTIGDGIEGTIQISAYAKAAIVVRHGGGSYSNGVFVVIKPAYPSTVQVYNGTTLVGSGTFPDQTPASVDFRIKLTGDRLDLWIGSTPTVFSGAPSMSFTGITIQAGWAGIARGTTIGDPSGTGTLSSWRTHLDAAFEVEITDPVPEGISDPANISAGGVNNAGVITWKLISGKTPLPFGTTADLSWEGTFSSCEKITNVAYVNTRGITGNQLGVCYDINCASSACTLTGGKIGNSETICYNTIPSALSELNPATGGSTYQYNWQSSEDLVQWSDIQGATTSGFTPPALTATTHYRRKVSSPGCPDTYSDTVTITVLPEIIAPVIAEDQIICEGSPASDLYISTEPLGGDDLFTYQWQQSSDDITFTDIHNAIGSSFSPGSITVSTWYRLKAQSFTCEVINSPSVKITVNPLIPVSVSIDDPGAACEGQSVTFTATPVNAVTPTYQWFKNNVPVFNATLGTFTSNELADGDIIKVEVTTADNCANPSPAVSNEVTVNLSSGLIPSVSIDNPGVTCAGEPVTFTASPVNGGAAEFQWYINGNPQLNETSVTFTSNSLQNGDIIKVEMTARASCTNPAPVTSNEVIANITDQIIPSVSINDPGEICTGQQVTFTATPVHGGNPAYQWFKNGSAVLNETDASYTSNDLSEGDLIHVEMVSDATCATTQPMVSNKVTARVTSNVIPSVTINDPDPFCFGEQVSFTAVPVNGGVPEYQWFKNNVAIPNETGSTFTSTSLSNGDVIKVEIISSATCASTSTAVSNEVVISVNPAVIPSVSIKASASTICAGDLVIFNIDQITGQGGDPEYQWYLNDMAINGETDNNFASSNLDDGAEVRLVIKSSDKCASPDQAESQTLTITHSSRVSPSLSIDVKDGGTTTVCEGELPGMEVVGTTGAGSAPQFQWKLNGIDIQDATGRTYTPASVSTGDKFTVEMTTNSSCATSPSATSNELTFEVLTRKTPEVSIKATTGENFCKGNSVTFRISSEEHSGNNPAYQWLKNGFPINEANDREYTSSSLSDNDVISLNLTSNATCLASENVISNELIMRESTRPEAVITTNKSSFCNYEMLQLSTVDVNGYNYQWFLNGNAVSGAGSASYLTNIEGIYTVRITNAEGCDSLSVAFSISKIPALPVTVKNKSAINCPQDAPTLVSSVTNPSYTYFWLNENNQVVQPQDSIFIPSNSGTYRVVVNSGNCSDTSAALPVNIRSLTTPQISGPLAPVCESRNVQYRVANPQAGSGYQWLVPAGATVVSGQGTATVNVDFGTVSGEISVTEILSSSCPGLTGKLNISLQQCDFQADFLADQTTVCAGKSINFFNTSSGTSANTSYLWDFGNGMTYQGENPEPVMYLLKGQYTVSLTITDGISKTETKTNYITVNDAEAISSVNGPSISCVNGQATFTAVSYPGYTYTWKVSNATLISATGNSATVVFPSAGITEVVLEYNSNAGCPGTGISKSVTVNQVPQVQLTSPRTWICNNENTQITAIGAAPGTSFSWYRDHSDLTGESGPQYLTSEQGMYWVKLNNGSCTWHSDTIEITRSNLSVDAGPDVSVEEGSMVELFAQTSTPAKSYSWQPGGIPPVQNPTVMPAYPTKYIVTVTDNNGCTASDSVMVNIITPLYIPNAFTPNGDGIHDEWVIEGTETLQDFSYEIFNRWGAIVFDSTKDPGRWKGTHNGKELPVATYYYVIRYKVNGEEKTKAGSVLLSK